MYNQTRKTEKRFLALFLSLAMVMTFSFTSLAGTVFAKEAADPAVAEQAAFSESATVDGVDVTVKAEKGVFPAGSSLKVKKDSVPKSVDTKNAAAAYAYDITIFDKDGNEIQPEGKAEVSFKTGEVKDSDTAVYHMDGNKPEKLKVTEKGDTAKVKTDGFSTYVLVFTVTGAISPNYAYTMGEDQKATLKELIQSSGYKPTDYGTHYADDSLSYQYNNAESSDSSKVAISNSASPEYYAYCPSGATFNDGEQLSIRIPWSYQYKSSATDTWHTANGVATIRIAVSAVEGNIVAPVPKEGLVFNDQPQTLVSAATTELKGITFEYKVDNGDWAAWGTDGPQATEAGDHTVYWRAMGDNGSVDEGEVVATIAEIEVTEPVAEESLVYNGENQLMIAQEASTTATGVTIKYAISEKNADIPSDDKWTDNYKDTVKAVKKNAGDYWIWYRVGYLYGPQLLSWIDVVTPAHIDASIAKADCPVEVESAGTLMYNGSDQVLVRELNNDPTGTPPTKPFKIQYSVDNGSWTEGVDNATGKEAKEYNIRWKFEGDDNYNPASGEVYTTIVQEENKMYADVDYTEKQAETDKDGEWVYDGEKHGITVTPKVMKQGATEPEVVTDAKVYYSLDKDLTEDNYKTEGSTSAASVYPRDAGDYTIYYYVESKDYAPVSGSKDVKIKKAYLKITVVDKETTYGTLMQYQDYELDEAQNEGFITIKAFKESAETTDWTYVEDSIDGRSNFKFDTGGYEDEMSDAKTYTIKAQRDILSSNNYIIRYKDGKLVVHKKPVTFTWSTPQEWTYDGKAHRVDARINKDDLVGTDGKDDEQVTFKYVSDQEEFTNEATNVRRIPDPETPEHDWEVGDYTAQIESLGGERGHNYTMYQVAPETGEEIIDPETGKKVLQETAKQTFRINPVELTLTPNDVTAIYGEAAKDEGFEAVGLIEGEKIEDVLLGEPEYEFVDYAAGSDVGTYDIKITNVEDPNVQKSLHAQNYTVKAEANKGGLTVVQRAVTLKWAPSNKFEYNGQYRQVKVVSAANDYAGNSAIKPEPTYTNAKKVNAGKYTAVAKLSAQDAKNYKILNNSDKFSWEITKRPATIYAKNKTIVYTQSPANNGYYVDKKPLVKNVENGDKLDSIGDVTFKYNYAKNGKPGNYKIIPVVSNLNPNYYIAKKVNGKLTVNYKQKILLAQGKASGKKGVRLAWNSVSGAKKYEVYFSQCDTAKKKFKPKKVKTLKGKTFRIGKLKKHQCYKFYVVAKDKNGKKIAKSLQSHVITTNSEGKLTNAKSLKVRKNKITVARGASVNIKSKLKKYKSNKTLLDQGHVALRRYTSANKKVATVSATGAVTGMSKGWCKVYVHSANGLWQEVQVTVK